jgi:glycosyltransferase involved in cell wall biosynthesis
MVETPLGSTLPRMAAATPLARYDVLFSMPWAGPLLDGSGATGGAETQILMIARRLAAGGLRVGILVLGDRARMPRWVDGVDVLARPHPPAVRGVGGLLHDLRTAWAILRTPAHTVVARAPGRDAAVVALAARLRGKRFVYSSANVVDFELGKIDRPWNVALFEWAVKTADEVVVQTSEQAELCRSRFGRDPVVIRSVAEAAPPRRGEAEAFLWIGRSAAYKRPDVYLDLAARVPEARFRMIAAGGTNGRPGLTDRLARASTELPNLEILDARPRSELGAVIERAVAVVNTSDFEGMPNVLLEGWARGVPALAFAHDPDGVVARHGLGEYAGGSRERLAELARELWASRSDQHEVAERCIAYVRREHDLEAVGAAWRSLLERVGAR